jgi:hypothetical protein
MKYPIREHRLRCSGRGDPAEYMATVSHGMVDANATNAMEVVGSEVCNRAQQDALHEPLQCGVRFVGGWVAHMTAG